MHQYGASKVTVVEDNIIKPSAAEVGSRKIGTAEVERSRFRPSRSAGKDSQRRLYVGGRSHWDLTRLTMLRPGSSKDFAAQSDRGGCSLTDEG
jgi:hypothetical protein